MWRAELRHLERPGARVLGLEDELVALRDLAADRLALLVPPQAGALKLLETLESHLKAPVTYYAPYKHVHLQFLTCKFSCGILGTASELGFGNRVIERKPLDESLP